MRDVTERKGIPVATVPRLIADLSVTAEPAIYRQVLREAEYKGFRKRLPKAYVPTRSEFERAMLAFCDRHGLPLPRTRVKIGQWEADFLFEEEGLFVETDGWRGIEGGSHSNQTTSATSG